MLVNREEKSSQVEVRDEKGGVNSLLDSLSVSDVKSLVVIEFPEATVGNLLTVATGKGGGACE